MRLRCLLVLWFTALALAGCAKPRLPFVATPVQQQYSELDAMMYGEPLPPSATVRHVREVVPVVETFQGGLYTLDSGDRLRIVVFGQDALSNIYIVDGEGQVALPLIGAVSARGLSSRLRSRAGSPTATSASRAWRSRSISTGRSSCWARSPTRANTLMCPT